jgi:hypothetical protein
VRAFILRRGRAVITPPVPVIQVSPWPPLGFERLPDPAELAELNRALKGETK